MSTSSNTTFEFDVNHNGEIKLNPLIYQHGSLLNIHIFQMDFEDMVSYLKWKIPRQFTTLYYMLPPNYALSGMKQIKNDYETNVMYDIAKVVGKLQIFVSHTPIDLSTVLIPNNDSLEESLAGFKVKSGVPCQVHVRKEDVLVLKKAHGDIISILWAPKPIRVGAKRVNFETTVGEEKKLKICGKPDYPIKQ
ncbi:hypothetical protein Tco_0559093 [Tanacetum coccineum]